MTIFISKSISSNYSKFWSSTKSGATSASPDLTSSSKSTSLSRVVTTRCNTALEVFYVKWLAFWKSYADSTIWSPQLNSISWGLWGCSTKSFRTAKRFAMTLQSSLKSVGGSRTRFVSLLKVTFKQTYIANHFASWNPPPPFQNICKNSLFIRFNLLDFSPATCTVQLCPVFSMCRTDSGE